MLLTTPSATGPTKTPPLPAPSSSPNTPVDPKPEAPTMALSDLPTVKRGKGSMAVSSTPNPCTIKVDGVPRGVTPILQLDLLAGDHTIECAPIRGKTSSISVRVKEGATSTQLFHTN
jgi:hypothetical protein